MKPTDFAPRVTPFITHLTGKNLIGVEVGCDVGAHAEAILTHASVDKLYLVDRFDNPNLYWYLKGRLETKPNCRQRFEIMNMDSYRAARELDYMKEGFDFVYIDITHDADTVLQSLNDWWPLVKKGGLLGYRNYSDTYSEVKKAVDLFFDFVPSKSTKVESYQAEIIIWK